MTLCLDCLACGNTSQVVRTQVYVTTSLLIRTTTMMLNAERHFQDYCHIASVLPQSELTYSSIVPQMYRSPCGCCTLAQDLSTSELLIGRTALAGAGNKLVHGFTCRGITRIRQARRAGHHRKRQILACCRQLRLAPPNGRTHEL